MTVPWYHTLNWKELLWRVFFSNRKWLCKRSLHGLTCPLSRQGSALLETIQGLSPCVLLSDRAAEGCIEKKQKVFLTFTEQGLRWLDVAPRLTPLGLEVFLSIRPRILLSSSMLSHLPPGDMGKPHFTKVIKNYYIREWHGGVIYVWYPPPHNFQVSNRIFISCCH